MSLEPNTPFPYLHACYLPTHISDDTHSRAVYVLDEPASSSRQGIIGKNSTSFLVSEIALSIEHNLTPPHHQEKHFTGYIHPISVTGLLDGVSNCASQRIRLYERRIYNMSSINIPMIAFQLKIEAGAKDELWLHQPIDVCYSP